MGDKTGIEWTDATWNPIRGCSRVSEGCRNCYAETVARRFNGPGQPYEGLIARGGQWNGQVRLVPEKLDEPLRWRKPRRIFVNSMSDLFHEQVPVHWLDEIFAVMALAPQHTFQVLTKRPERMQRYLADESLATVGGRLCAGVSERIAVRMFDMNSEAPDRPWPLPNVWLGVSVEDQATADERIPLLLRTPAAVRWVSAEPLLGPVDLYNGDPDPRLGGHRATKTFMGEWWQRGDDLRGPARQGIDWLVAGGESGPGARPMHPDWVRSLRDQCQAAGVAFHFKQWGEWAPAPVGQSAAHGEKTYVFPDGSRQRGYTDAAARMSRYGKKRAGRELDGRTWDEYPEVSA